MANYTAGETMVRRLSHRHDLLTVRKVHVKLLITRDILITVIASFAAYRLESIAIFLGGVAYLTTTLLLCGYHVDEQGIIRGQ